MSSKSTQNYGNICVPTWQCGFINAKYQDVRSHSRCHSTWSITRQLMTLLMLKSSTAASQDATLPSDSSGSSATMRRLIATFTNTIAKLKVVERSTIREAILKSIWENTLELDRSNVRCVRSNISLSGTWQSIRRKAAKVHRRIQ